MTWKPHVTVAAIAQKKGKFLMVEELIDGRMVYNQPAGHLEPGETLVQAVIRETLEETAWHFRPDSITGIYQWHNKDSDTSFIRFCFAGDCLLHDEQRTLDTDINQAIWLSLEEIESKYAAMRSPMVMHCLRDYLDGCRQPLSILTGID